MKTTSDLLIKDVAVIDGFYIHHKATLNQAVEKMKANEKGVVVLLKGKKPVAIFTERDLIKVLYEGVSLKEEIINYANKSVVTIKQNRTLLFALNIMIDNNIRRVVVIDSKGNYVGIVNQEDLIKHLEKHLTKENLKVFHIFTSIRKLITIKQNTTLKKALGLMVKNKISSVVITNNEGIAIGIITERDILKYAGVKNFNESVTDFMSTPVITVKLDSDFKDVVNILNNHNIRRVIIEDNKHNPIGIITERDILRNVEGSYSRFLEDRLKSAKDILNFLPEIIIDIVTVGKEKVIQWCNKKAQEEFGENLIDKPITHLIPNDYWNNIYTQLIKNNRIEKNQIKIGEKYFEILGYFLKPTDTSAIQLILKDITFQVKLSIKDHLTNLYNRRYMEEFLVNEFEASRRYGHSFSLVMVDLDNFKQINDTFGHESGDIVLKTVSDIIICNMRKADVVGRYGGEEFLILLPKTIKQNAKKCMEKIRKLINKQRFNFNNHQIKITASFGISSYPEDCEDIQDLLAISDIRLYRAKRMGKNRIEIA